MSMIQVKNLTKTYQQGDIVVTALDHVSVEIEKGEFIAISGPSGSGKTTLLNLMVGLADQMHRRPSELSGGQQQRVAVARAVVSSPAMVLADEPTANLDSETGENLLKMMLEMNQQHQVTFIFSTHDHMVMEYARRIITIKDGKIV